MNKIISFLFLLLCFQNAFAFEGWKKDGWKIGDSFWWIYPGEDKCNKHIKAWRIEDINNNVARIIRKSDRNIDYWDMKKMGAYSTEESAKKGLEYSEKKCKEKRVLRKKYEK